MSDLEIKDVLDRIETQVKWIRNTLYLLVCCGPLAFTVIIGIMT